MDAQKDLVIDRNALDTMLVEQPSLFHRYADAHATAVSQRDYLKEQLAQLYAKLDARIRRDNSGSRITEKFIESEIAIDPDYVAATDELLQAKQSALQMEAAKEAFGQRGWVLRDLTALYIAGYWSQNSVGSRAVTDVAVDERRRRIGVERHRLNNKE